MNNDCRMNAVLFDLDGTLVDSGPDLFAALNSVRSVLGLPVADFNQVSHAFSQGGAAILRAGITEITFDIEACLSFFLNYYRSHIFVHSRLYEGIEVLLNQLDSQHIPWGIVTNKSTELTQLLVSQLGFEKRLACLVCGDTTAYKKPHPEPLLLACRTLKTDPQRVVFLGDDLRDVEAALSAGAVPVLAQWGYGVSQAKQAKISGLVCINRPYELLAVLENNFCA